MKQHLKALFSNPGHPTLRSLVICTVLVALAGSAGYTQAGPYLFDSLASIRFDQEIGGVFYYDMDLQSLDLVNGKYRDIYIVMDRSLVVHGDAPALPEDVHFISAEITSEPGIDLWFSADMRSFANMNNSDFLDDQRMDLYDPDLVDPLADNCFYVDMKMGINRELTVDEMYNFGYWGGDLSGTKIPGAPFTESDGGPVPEPSSLLLALAGGAGLYRKLRKP